MAQEVAGQLGEGMTTLAQALDLVEETDERFAEAELYQVQAELLLMHGDDARAEVSLHKAIEVARRQQAKSWGLLSTVSLCRLWQQPGRTEGAHQLLADVYGWFTEGLDTPDLQEARALLEELS